MNKEVDYETLCEEIRKQNEEYLEIFKQDLIKAGLKEKTIRNHLDNTDFYINTYLTNEGPLKMQEGCDATVGDYLGYYYIYKCMWSTPENIKTTAASLKKFYKSMMEHGYVGEEEYKFLCDFIKEERVEWQEECAMFNEG